MQALDPNFYFASFGAGYLIPDLLTGITQIVMLALNLHCGTMTEFFKRLLQEYSPNCFCDTFPTVFRKTIELPTCPYLFKCCQSPTLHNLHHPFRKDALNYDNKGTTVIGLCRYLRYLYFLMFRKKEHEYFPLP